MAADKHALLIAIEDYSQTPFNSLKGPINDIFIILSNKQATHTGIENGFKKLIQRVQANDFVYIYYSGHGSQTLDLNGDELSGKDQTWVSYAARSSNNVVFKTISKITNSYGYSHWCC
ncbi:caspase family protein [Candidatus Marithrix sp. Canyon 246]|uniref:caspase family protein n=1 Tax=Candidatus Marithrix sp. Canyon 246 TaxID=1827136 RepID=UPI00114C9C97|nr:caspase family protein [Candidatus Marithrix sp. Canyon 246]